MNYETEWERRNRDWNEKLQINIFTFTSRHNEDELKLKRHKLIRNLILFILGFSVFTFALYTWIIWMIDGDKYTLLEIIKINFSLFHQFDIREDLLSNFYGRIKLCSIIFFILMLYYYIQYEFKKTKISYAKEITINLNTKIITYKETDKQIEFTINEIKEWLIYPSIQKKQYGDIFILKDGRTLDLDGFYEDNLHLFFETHAEDLHLPKFRRMRLNDIIE